MNMSITRCALEHAMCARFNNTTVTVLRNPSSTNPVFILSDAVKPINIQLCPRLMSRETHRSEGVLS